MIDFSVETEFQQKLDWMNRFVREECELVDLLFPHSDHDFDAAHRILLALVDLPRTARVVQGG